MIQPTPLWFSPLLWGRGQPPNILLECQSIAICTAEETSFLYNKILYLPSTLNAVQQLNTRNKVKNMGNNNNNI